MSMLAPPPLRSFNPLSEVWAVKLSNPDLPYDYTHIHRRYAKFPDYEVVIVDTIKFIELVENAPSLVIPKITAETANDYFRLPGLIAFMNTTTIEGTPEMPVVSVMFRRNVKKYFFGLLEKDMGQLAYISFENGRHRTRFFEWAGAQSFPVEVPRSAAQTLRELCGVSI